MARNFTKIKKGITLPRIDVSNDAQDGDIAYTSSGVVARHNNAWEPLGGGGSGIPTGAWVFSFDTVAPPSWILMDGKTIGSPDSGATGLADDSAYALFIHLWNKSANTILPIQNSAGSPTTRGASAEDDWDDNKRLPIPDMRGRAGIGLDNMGGTSADRVTDAYADSVGGAGGSATHALTTAQMPSHTHPSGTLATQGSIATWNSANAAIPSGGAHTHGFSGSAVSRGGNSGTGRELAIGDGNDWGTYTPSGTITTTGSSHTHVVNKNLWNTNQINHTHTMTGSTASTGSGNAHPNMQPSMAFAAIMKL